MNNKFKRRKRAKKSKNKRLASRFRLVSYSSRTSPSSLGPGFYKLGVSKLISGSLENEIVIDIFADVVYQNPEFERVQKDFKYFKIIGVTVTFFTRNLPISNNQKPAYLIINYDGKTTVNMRLQDTVKIIPAFLTRDKRFRFNIPRVNTFAGALNNWVVETDIQAWGQIWLQIHSPENTTDWNFRVDAIIQMKGPTSASTTKTETKVANLKHKLTRPSDAEIRDRVIAQNTQNTSNKRANADSLNRKDAGKNEIKEEPKEEEEGELSDEDWFIDKHDN